MSIYETVKAAVTVRQAAKRYETQISNNHMTRCLFHPDRHPSMKLNEDYYYCFGCEATGDVIDLTAKLFDIGKYEAAIKLAEDFGIDPNDPPEAVALKPSEKSALRAFEEDERYCRKVLCDYLHLLERWKKDCAPKNPVDEWDDRFVEACQMKDHIESLADTIIFGDFETRKKLVWDLLENGTIDGLEKILERHTEGGDVS